jgi:hypothetical protein
MSRPRKNNPDHIRRHNMQGDQVGRRLKPPERLVESCGSQAIERLSPVGATPTNFGPAPNGGSRIEIPMASNIERYRESDIYCQNCTQNQVYQNPHPEGRGTRGR